MIRLLIYAIVGIVFIFIFTEIIKFLTAISGTRSQMIKDKTKFLESFDCQQIIEWPWAELTTLSTFLDYGTSKYDLITSAQEAAYLSIYSEKIGYMFSKKYGEKEVLLIMTHSSTYELYQGEANKVTLTVDNGKPIPVAFSKDQMTFSHDSHDYILEKNHKRGEIKINEKTILLTNDDLGSNDTLNRLVAIQPEDVNSNHHSIVKFLLLFYLIWRQDK